MKRAVKGWDEKVPADVPKTFIFTGNFLNEKVLPAMISAGAGKSATAHLIAAATMGYRGKGYR